MIRRTHSRRRGGFTLIEMLIVIAILGILAGLVVAAVFGFLDGQSRKNTQLLLQKVDNALQQQWSEVRQQAQKEPPPASVLNLAGGPGNDARAQVIWVKLRLKQEFPMSYAEALNPGGGVIPELRPLDSYVKTLSGRTAANDPKTEMAACLLMALRRPRTGKNANPDESLGASAIKDTDGDGIAEIVDGWGRPVGFCRWGTGNPALTSLSKATSPLNNDNQDPLMTLMSSTWNVPNSQSVATFQGLCHSIRDGAGNPASYFTIPVIVSAGKDGIMGLNLPPSSTYPWDMSLIAPGTADNIYSFLVR